MNKALKFCLNRATVTQIAAHLRACDDTFVPPLSERVDIDDYSYKIADKAERFEVWIDGDLIGLVAAYCNDSEGDLAFITSVSVLTGWQGQGLASRLVAHCIDHVRGLGIARIELEVNELNRAALSFYENHRFSSNRANGAANMYLDIEQEAQMGKQRDYNAEINDAADHQYAYRFDFDVMHPYMIRSFEPFFRMGSLLELGSYTGDFTKRLLPYSDDVTCVEASDLAIQEAQRRLGDKVTYVHSLFENVVLPKRYDNIVLTHVLEHLDDPVRVLKRVNDEWLAEGGRLFLVCPNANAPSRQIAVKMGLIAHNTAVTPVEAEHGHRCTYALDTLEHDAVAAGLNVVHRSGIFFKALANFQWDRLLNTDIVSKEYLEGCYKLGQQYPDLCASLFLMCEKGSPRD